MNSDRNDPAKPPRRGRQRSLFEPRREPAAPDDAIESAPRPPADVPSPAGDLAPAAESPARHALPEISEAPRPEPLTVSELNALVRELLEDALPRVWVRGELTGVQCRRHWYFTLKDDFAQIRCVMWQREAARVPFELEDGLEVIVAGRLSVYEARGQYQLYVDEVVPQGLGALQLAFEQLKERLAKEGLFAAERKRPLPVLPRRVGVITSRHGAALRDVHRAIRHRFPNMPLLIANARVQGDGAAAEVVAAIQLMNRYAEGGGDVDVLLITRGGGSYEDLAAFNDEALARAIAASRLPTVAAIGHEVDVTIADFVADRRATTPTDGARLVVPDRAVLERQLGTLAHRSATAIRQRLAIAHARVQQSAGRLERASPRMRLLDMRHRLAAAEGRLTYAMRQRLDAARRRLERARETIGRLDPRHTLLPDLRDRLTHADERLRRAIVADVQQRRQRVARAAAALDAYSPLKVLARGYSVTADTAGHVVTDAAAVEINDELVTRLHRGSLRSRVTEVTPPAEAEIDGTQRP